ncbi:MAG: PorV/PorQ family protein [Candidatus Auribacterota bacterium]
MRTILTRSIITYSLTCLLAYSLTCLLAHSLYGKGLGTTGAQFLKITPGVRPAAMGNVFVGVANDVNTINYNTGGLGFLTGTEILLMHNEWFEEINIEHIAAIHKLQNIGTIGLTGTMLTMGKIDKYDNTGTALNETYTASDLSAGLSYSLLIDANFCVGLVLKYIQQKIENEQATGFGADIGLLYRGLNISEKVLPVGISVKNIGTEIKFREEGAPLPMLISLGASYEPIKSLNTAVDVRYSNELQLTVGIGLEQKLTFSHIDFGIRAGYDTTTLQSKLDGLSGLSAGLGVATNPVGLDFSWAPYGDVFKNTFRLGLTLKLGK